VKSSVLQSNAASKGLVEHTIQIWQPRLQRNLGPDDAGRIVENITAFSDVLAEWSRAELATPDGHSGQSVTASSFKHGGEKVMP
jgi:hypothetical protein